MRLFMYLFTVGHNTLGLLLRHEGNLERVNS